MAAVAPLPLPQRLSVLRMAIQLIHQKLYDEYADGRIVGQVQ